MKTPDAILVGDIHYRDDQPKCRLDAFWETQKRKALWLKDLWKELGEPPVLQAGDVFHKWKSSPQVISAVLEYFPPMTTAPGNHDLPSHSLDLFGKSALNVVSASEIGWDVAFEWTDYENYGFELVAKPWGIEPEAFLPAKNQTNPVVLLCHKMILAEKEAFDGEYAGSFLRRIKGYDLILSGHNHRQFTHEFNGKLLVNPGSFTRQTADENHEPAIYLWYAGENRVERIPIPIEDGIISREHIDNPKLRDERITAFVERLDQEVGISIQFKDNVLAYLEGNEIRSAVKERVLEAVD